VAAKLAAFRANQTAKVLANPIPGVEGTPSKRAARPKAKAEAKPRARKAKAK
jgi:hypothetical protein